jgi:hypothetical protein
VSDISLVFRDQPGKHGFYGQLNGQQIDALGRVVRNCAAVAVQLKLAARESVEYRQGGTSDLRLGVE